MYNCRISVLVTLHKLSKVSFQKFHQISALHYVQFAAYRTLKSVNFPININNYIINIIKYRFFKQINSD